ncbi:MAG TPA: hypothetical protein K8V11_05010 [Dietzia timorensis]|uniref:Uncharacterized protein n=1 Tax=Dietzia timorensis TaxID=499555 RepID=A0A921JXY8_9ACTN|nr:hypothetical protein [Dietzia timorensis]HJE90348.1 hypothetical protein [Dietzia timorensis]
MTSRWLPVATLAVVAVDAPLLAAGAISWPLALALIVAIEVPLTVLSVARYVRLFRSARAEGSVSAFREVVDGDPLLRVAAAEMRIFASLGRWILRMPDVPGGTVAVGYARGALGVPAAFAVAAVVETVVVHILVPSPTVRIALALLSLYGLLFLLGWMGSQVVRPHLIYSDRLVVRSGNHVVAEIPRASIARLNRARDPRTPRDYINVEDDRTVTLTLAGPDGTNVRLDFAAPAAVRMPSLPWARREAQVVGRIRLSVDDPSAMVAQLSATADRL